jgi:hypothetical protein
MSKKRTCAYCGRETVPEKEHVFPESWYPSTTPENLDKVHVPSCHACNRRWRETEEHFAFDVWLGLSPEYEEVKGVVDSFIRSFSIARGQNAPDARKRMKKALALQRTMLWVDPRPGAPRRVVRLESGVFAPRSPARRLQPKVRSGMAEKFIRGLHYAETEQCLPTDLTVETCQARGHMMVPSESDAEFWNFVDVVPLDRSVAPAFLYGRVHTLERSAWRFLLWGQVTLLAFASPGIDPATIPPDAVARSRP